MPSAVILYLDEFARQLLLGASASGGRGLRRWVIVGARLDGTLRLLRGGLSGGYDARMRAGIVLTSFLPFLYYATKDTLFHFHGRRVSLAEHLLHLAIGLSLVIVVVNAVLGQLAVMLAGLVLFAIAGGLDEYVWHRQIPEIETDLHAKEHLALLMFVVVTLVVQGLDSHSWQIPREWSDRLPGVFRPKDHSAEHSLRQPTPPESHTAPWGHAVVTRPFAVLALLFTVLDFWKFGGWT